MLVEIVCTHAHMPHATRLAEELHSYWPQLALRLHPHKSSKDAPRISPFDVLWVERWGTSRHSAVMYTHGGKGEQGPPHTRTLWRELHRKIYGQLVLRDL